MNLDTFHTTLGHREQQIAKARVVLSQLQSAQEAGAHVILVAKGEVDYSPFTEFQQATGPLVMLYEESSARWAIKSGDHTVGNLWLSQALSCLLEKDITPEAKVLIEEVARATFRPEAA